MSGEEEEEYEVESVLAAKVEKALGKGRPKNPKLNWKYHVRWKNYTAADDTWEPITSFNGSEHIVAAFWERANVGGRDVDDLTQFELGETFLPVGPPRKKRKALEEPIVVSSKSPEPPQQSKSQKSTKTADRVEVSVRPTKRHRGDDQRSPQPNHTPISSSTSKAPRSSRSKPQRQISPEVIPDSDEEMGSSALQTFLTPTSAPRTTRASQKQKEPSEPIELEPVEIEQEPYDPLFDELEKKVPEHIARKTNPLVIMVDDPNLSHLEGAISAKSRTTRSSKGETPQSTSRRMKPGPGRSSGGLTKNKSSLLTAEKGSLKIMKGNYTKEEPAIVNEGLPELSPEVVKPAPPSAEELLDLAGLDSNAADLPDFEDGPDDKGEEAEVERQAMEIEPSTPVNGDSASTSKSVAPSFPGHNLFPQTATAASPSMPSEWKRASTIFGPLTLGVESPPKSQSAAERIYLNVDSSVSIPALLVNSTSLEMEGLTFKMKNNDTPGAFYNSEVALTLLGSVRAGGISARITIDENSADDEKHQFKHFTTRLQSGDLFVASAGINLLVFCSAGNTLLAQRLNIPPSLHNSTETIVVSQVTITNYTAYADASSRADVRRWVQYIATTS